MFVEHNFRRGKDCFVWFCVLGVALGTIFATFLHARMAHCASYFMMDVPVCWNVVGFNESTSAAQNSSLSRVPGRGQALAAANPAFKSSRLWGTDVYSADSVSSLQPEMSAPAAPAVDPEAARIADMVAEIKDYLKLLYVKREMNFNEVRLTLAIEDPRLADRRERYGIEDESGVSADEKVEALEAIDAGEIPTDALVVETLLQDFREWPGLDSEVRKERGPSRYAEIANQAAGIKTQIEEERRAAYVEDDGDEKDGNPFGFLVLYGVSAVPIFITIAALSIMFVNSLQ